MALLALIGALAVPAQAPPFEYAVERVTAAQLRQSWRPGCPVPPARLRRVRLSYWGFDRTAHEGALVVHERGAVAIVSVFRRLYAARFPIRRVRTVDAYGGSDDRSMAADNTSAFNCRFVGGTRRWSAHAYGLAIDVNPVENPYVQGSRVSPPAGRRFLDRTSKRRGMAYPGGVLLRAFDAVGWGWGGRWAGSRDYQHFSSTGN